MTAVQGSWQYRGGGKGFDPRDLLRRLLRLFKGGGSLSIVEYLDDRLVVFLDVTTQTEAIAVLVDALDAAHKLKDKQEFHQAILDREKIVSTGIGLNLAIPHAKLAGYEEFFIAVGVQAKGGIEWNSLDKTSVHLVFMIGGPDHRQTEYLSILSKLTLALKDENRRKSLMKATSAQQVIDLFRGC